MIRDGGPEEDWSYPIPLFYFEACVCEISVASSKDGAAAWKRRILASSICKEWVKTPPRAQFALVRYSHEKGLEIGRSHIEAELKTGIRDAKMRSHGHRKLTQKVAVSKRWVDLRVSGSAGVAVPKPADQSRMLVAYS